MKAFAAGFVAFANINPNWNNARLIERFVESDGLDFQVHQWIKEQIERQRQVC